jgi:hypothetical protein
MLKTIRQKLSLGGTPKSQETVKAPLSDSASAGPEVKDRFENSSDSGTKASQWDTMTRVEKAGASVVGGWLGLGVLGTLLAVSTPIAGPVALAIGAAAGLATTQVVGRASKTDQTKAQAAENLDKKLSKPVKWNDTTIGEKARILGSSTGTGALVLGSLAVAATTLAAPVAIGIGAAVGLAGGIGMLATVRNSDFQDWDSGSSDSDSGGSRMSTNGELQYSLGGGHYIGSGGEWSTDHGLGELHGVDGKSNGRLL